MRKLKECKNFGEIYEVIGEENFADIAKLLVTLLIASPIFCGIQNFAMLLQIDNYYNAYDYNYKCVSIMYVVFVIITIWSLLYYGGKLQYEKKGIKIIFSELKENNPWLIPWFVLLIWTIIPIALSSNVVGSIIGATVLASGYVTHIFMFGIMGCVAMIPEEDRIDLFRSFVIIWDIWAIITISYEYNVPFISHFTAYGGIAVYTNQNHYAYVLVLVIVCAMGLYYTSDLREEKKLRKYLYLFSITLNVYVLMINDTMGAFVAIVLTFTLGIIIWKCSGNKIGWEILVPGIIIAALTYLSAVGVIPPCKTWHEGTTIGTSFARFWNDLFKVAKHAEGSRSAGSRRWGIWIDTVEMIKESPIWGYGPDVMISKTGKQMYDTPHNEYLECAFFMGIPGLALYLWGLFALLVNKCKRIKELSLTTLIASVTSIGYLISAFFGVRKFNTVCFFFMFMGLLVSKKNLKKN